MSQQILVSEVLSGSRRIDEMKEEIELLIKIVVGLIHSHDLGSEIWPKNHESEMEKETAKEIKCDESCEWKIVMRRSGGHYPYIHCVKWYGGGLAVAFLIEGRADWRRVTRERVIHIHKSLQSLLDSLVIFFPDLEKELSPFRQALK